MQHLPRGAVKIVRNFDTRIFKILIIKLVLFSEELYYVSVLWFIYSSCLPGLYFGCFCSLNAISLVPYLCVLLLVIQYGFREFFKVCFVFFNKIFYRPVYKKSLPPILLFIETARRYCYCNYTSVAESRRHIKISILLSTWRTDISKFLTIFLM